MKLLIREKTLIKLTQILSLNLIASESNNCITNINWQLFIIILEYKNHKSS